MALKTGKGWRQQTGILTKLALNKLLMLIHISSLHNIASVLENLHGLLTIIYQYVMLII